MNKIETEECKKTMKWFEEDFSIKPHSASVRYNSWRNIFRGGELIVDRKYYRNNMPSFYYGFEVIYPVI